MGSTENFPILEKIPEIEIGNRKMSFELLEIARFFAWEFDDLLLYFLYSISVFVEYEKIWRNDRSLPRLYYYFVSLICTCGGGIMFNILTGANKPIFYLLTAPSSLAINTLLWFLVFFTPFRSIFNIAIVGTVLEALQCIGWSRCVAFPFPTAMKASGNWIGTLLLTTITGCGGSIFMSLEETFRSGKKTMNINSITVTLEGALIYMLLTCPITISSIFGFHRWMMIDLFDLSIYPHSSKAGEASVGLLCQEDALIVMAIWFFINSQFPQLFQTASSPDKKVLVPSSNTDAKKITNNPPSNKKKKSQ